MTKTLSERVLNVTRRQGRFNMKVAKRSFKNYDTEYMHNSVMRTARELENAGLLKRTSPGNYVLRSR